MNLLKCVFFLFGASLVASDFDFDVDIEESWETYESWESNFTFNSIDDLSEFLGATKVGHRDPLHEHVHSDRYIRELPSSFDARERWPNCPTIGHIRSQGKCGACWAFATAEVIGDRLCIHSDGNFTSAISTEDILACSGHGSCKGGSLAAFDYWVKRGVVTGGDFGSGDGCEPSSIHCAKTQQELDKGFISCHEKYPTPTCKKYCASPDKKPKSENRIYGKEHYYIPSDESQIRAEIYENGPVGAHMLVYKDFLKYKGDKVYKHNHYRFKKPKGGHLVKIIGWGEENGEPYWLVVNSWGTKWGNEGTFKIIRGQNECEIEDEVRTALP